MATPTKINFKLYQGSTFNEVLRWESSEKIYKPITGITKAAPVVVSALAHGVPVNWRIRVTNVAGMKEINSENYYIASQTTTDSVAINLVNSLSYSEYISGGVIEYNKPVELSGFTAKMQIRQKLEDTLVIKELTTENQGIILDNVLKTITVNISATDTSEFTFTSAVYSIELTSSGGIVTPFCSGTITLVREITR